MSKIEFNTQMCTTIEQSNRLLELGLKPETADMLHYKSASMKIWGVLATPYSEEVNGLEKYYFPAWSLHRLFAMICNYPCKEHFTFDFSMDYDSMEDVYDSTIEVIERHIKENNFNKEYLK